MNARTNMKLSGLKEAKNVDPVKPSIATSALSPAKTKYMILVVLNNFFAGAVVIAYTPFYVS